MPLVEGSQPGHFRTRTPAELVRRRTLVEVLDCSCPGDLGRMMPVDQTLVALPHTSAGRHKRPEAHHSLQMVGSRLS